MMAKYRALHSWVQANFDPMPCEFCNGEKGRMEWAQKHGQEGSRKREDWLRLCGKCHRKYDNNHAGEREKAKTHCPQGHLYDVNNTYIDPRGWRRCRTCKDEQQKAWQSSKS